MNWRDRGFPPTDGEMLGGCLFAAMPAIIWLAIVVFVFAGWQP